jgi:hypothetical protein
LQPIENGELPPTWCRRRVMTWTFAPAVEPLFAIGVAIATAFGYE